MMRRSTPHLVLGYHGCDAEVAEGIFSGRLKDLRRSENEYDWLGHGIYFWEANPSRALAYAKMLMRRPHRGRKKIVKPAVVGAVLDLGYSLNLLEASSISIIKQGYLRFRDSVEQRQLRMPENKRGGSTTDLLLRDLDCAVLEFTHALLESKGEPPFSSVRGAFIEGAPIYPAAGFHADTHIQICVRDRACIVGYFRPRPSAVRPI